MKVCEEYETPATLRMTTKYLAKTGCSVDLLVRRPGTVPLFLEVNDKNVALHSRCKALSERLLTPADQQNRVSEGYVSLRIAHVAPTPKGNADQYMNTLIDSPSHMIESGFCPSEICQ